MVNKKEVVKMFKDIMNAAKVGEHFGISRERVRQIVQESGISPKNYRRKKAIEALNKTPNERYSRIEAKGISRRLLKTVGGEIDYKPAYYKDGVVNIRLLKNLPPEGVVITHNLKYPIGSAHNVARRAGVKVSVKTISPTQMRITPK